MGSMKTKVHNQVSRVRVRLVLVLFIKDSMVQI